MPRLARLDTAGVLHHIVIRGMERGEILRHKQDKDNLIERLAAILPEAQTVSSAWALIPDHAHFLIRPGTCLI